MTRYIQRIALLGKTRWIGWDIDGVGTEVPGLTIADELSEAELRQRGVTLFRPMSFENFLELGAAVTAVPSDELELDDRDVDYRLDALQVGLDRIHRRGGSDLPKALFAEMFGGEQQIEHPRVQERLRLWQHAGAIEVVGRDECYVRVIGPLT